MNKWVARKEVNNRTKQTRWVVTRGDHRYTADFMGGGKVKAFRTRRGAENRALKLNVSEGWNFL